MHKEVMAFLQGLKREKRAWFTGKVIEYGSYDINGTVRDVFRAEEFVGVDHRQGPGVDVVSLMHEYAEKPDGYFDTAISTGTLEHDPHWPASLCRVIDLLKVGGTFVLTYAGPGYPRHEVDCSPEPDYFETPKIDTVIDVVQSHNRFRNVDYVVSDGRRQDAFIIFEDKLDD